MDDALLSSSTPPPPHRKSLLPRWNSISAPFSAPATLTLPHQLYSSATTSSSSGDFDLLSVKPLISSYTCLKDILPSAVVDSPKPNSPSNSQAQSASQICIRNRLVKKAAWAYLQPMSSPTDSSGPTFLHRLWIRFSRKNPIDALFKFLRRYVFGGFSRAFDWLVRSIRFRVERWLDPS